MIRYLSKNNLSVIKVCLVWCVKRWSSHCESRTCLDMISVQMVQLRFKLVNRRLVLGAWVWENAGVVAPHSFHCTNFYSHWNEDHPSGAPEGPFTAEWKDHGAQTCLRAAQTQKTTDVLNIGSALPKSPSKLGRHALQCRGSFMLMGEWSRWSCREILKGISHHKELLHFPPLSGGRSYKEQGHKIVMASADPKKSKTM